MRPGGRFLLENRATTLFAGDRFPRPVAHAPAAAHAAATGASGTPAGWANLSAEIAACTRCELHRTRRQVVIYRGAPRPRVLFVGEAPGAAEDLAGRPFVGRAGRRLDEAARSIGLADDAWGVLNLVKCRPPGNRFLPSAAEACRPFLLRQLDLLRPSVVVTLGRHALGALDPTAPPVTEAAGILRSWNGRPLFPLLHPAAPLHAPRLRERWARDLVALGSFLAPSAPSH